MEVEKLKYEEKVVQVRRVTKIVKGGKKMTFRVIIVLGDNNQKVGIGIGKAEDVNLATEKAILNGKKNLITVPITRSYSIAHVISASYGASRIIIKPASEGTGIIAGSSVKAVLELSGIKNVVAKQLGSNNILNNAKATILALIYLTEKIKLGKLQSFNKKLFYNRIIKKYLDDTVII
jgi:small subunit ribosomal protein S5